MWDWPVHRFLASVTVSHITAIMAAISGHNIMVARLTSKATDIRVMSTLTVVLAVIRVTGNILNMDKTAVYNFYYDFIT